MSTPEKQLENIIAKLAPYEEWQGREGIPIIRGHCVDDLRTAELGPWGRKGGKGAFVNLEGTEMSADAYICEIPSGGGLNPQRHMFEELIFILQAPIACSLSDLEPVSIQLVEDAGLLGLFQCRLARYHYLGFRSIVGENMKYMVFDRQQNPLACLLFGSAAWNGSSRQKGHFPDSS